MDYVFYSLAVLAIMWEAANITETKRIMAFKERMKQTNQADYTSNQKNFMFLNFGYIIWVIVGFFSSQWILFIPLLALGFIPKKSVLISKIDAVICICILVFILINKYHLQIDIPNLIF